MTKSVSKAKLARAVAKAKGPKAGSARSNQSVTFSKTDAKAKRNPGNATALRAKANDNLKALRGNPDTILTVVPAKGGNGVVASSNKHNVIIAQWQDNGATRKLAVVGGSVAALREHLATLVKPTAKLAQGVTAQNSPQSAKAVEDQRKGAPKATPAKAAPKAAKNKAPSKGSERNYKIGKTKNEARPDTWRFYMLQTIMGAKDTASAKAAHAKSGKFSSNKLDFTWADQKGYITFTK